MWKMRFFNRKKTVNTYFSVNLMLCSVGDGHDTA